MLLTTFLKFDTILLWQYLIFTFVLTNISFHKQLILHETKLGDFFVEVLFYFKILKNNNLHITSFKYDLLMIESA